MITIKAVAQGFGTAGSPYDSRVTAVLKLGYFAQKAVGATSEAAALDKGSLEAAGMSATEALAYLAKAALHPTKTPGYTKAHVAAMATAEESYRKAHPEYVPLTSTQVTDIFKQWAEGHTSFVPLAAGSSFLGLEQIAKRVQSPFILMGNLYAMDVLGQPSASEGMDWSAEHRSIYVQLAGLLAPAVDPAVVDGLVAKISPLAETLAKKYMAWLNSGGKKDTPDQGQGGDGPGPGTPDPGGERDPFATRTGTGDEVKKAETPWMLIIGGGVLAIGLGRKFMRQRKKGEDKRTQDQA
jgi:hypothetical protein